MFGEERGRRGGTGTASMMKSESCSAERSVDVVIRDLILEAASAVMRDFLTSFSRRVSGAC